MKIWYDACTGKHMRYGIAIARHLRSLGHEVIITTRKHPDTLSLAKFLGEEVVVMGKYDPVSLLTRLKESARRQLLFCKTFGKATPDIAISHGSVDQCRVAFGLGIPIISTLDTPYAEAVHRLTLPLSDYVVVSKAIPKEIPEKYNARGKIVGFDGVDEVAWIKDFKPRVKYNWGRPLIVVREYEEKAVYARRKFDFVELARRLTRLGNVVFLSRYEHKPIKGVITPKRFVDSASLVAKADLFVGVGGTITREAALQGIPTIIIEMFPIQHVNDYLIQRGFPIFKVKASNVLGLAKKLAGRKQNVTRLLNELENPTDVVKQIVGKLAAD